MTDYDVWHPDDEPEEWFDGHRQTWLECFWMGFWHCVFERPYFGWNIDYGYDTSQSGAWLPGGSFPKHGAYQAGWDEACGLRWRR